MSGKSCGIPTKQYPRRAMLGSAGLYKKNVTNNTNNTTLQIVDAIKKNRSDMAVIRKRTDDLEQSLMIEKSIKTSNVNIETKKIEEDFSKKLDLVKGDFKEQMAMLKNYIRVLETKLQNIENKIIKKNTVIPKKNDEVKKAPKKKKPEEKKPEEKKPIEKKPEEKKLVEKKPVEKKSKEDKPKEDTSNNKNVTLEIKEK